MKESVERIIKEATRIAQEIKLWSKAIRVVSHYDADGISSASIMAKALFREGKEFQLTLLKQLNEDALEGLSSANGMLIFLDFGSGQIDNIQKHLTKAGRIIISDHHQMQGKVSPDNSEHILHINPIEFGVEENISGSGMSYIIARAMNPENKDLSELAIVGAIGDSQIGSIESDWGLSGLNREILKDAESVNKIRVRKGLRLWGMHTRPVHKALEYSIDPYIPGVSGSESGAVQLLQDIGIQLKDNGAWRTLGDLSEEEEKKLASGIIRERIRGNQINPEWIFGDVYELISREKEFSNANEFATILNACGKLKKGYMGIALCLGDSSSYKEVKKVLEDYRRDIGRSLSYLYSNKKIIKTTDNASYILAEDKISEHTISNVTSIILRSGILPDKPLFAMVDTEDGKVKISARLSEELVKEGFNVKNIMAEAVKVVGGEGGGHIGAAGGTIPKGKEETFINTVEGILKNRTF